MSFFSVIQRKSKTLGKMMKDPELRKHVWERITFEIRKKHLIGKRDASYRHAFLENLLPVLDAMPESNGSRYYEKLEVKIAIIADEFLYDSYKGIADFIYITPDTYKEHVEEADVLLVASAWRGLHNEWRHMATEGTENNKVIFEVIRAYKEAGKIVVFYSKEDPPNYEHFLPIAKACDVIFTSCQEKMDDYRRDCRTDDVHVMEFCINPVFHNPIGMRNELRTNGVLFAGSWMKKYPDRIRSMEQMLDGVVESGKEMVIADRNFSQNNVNYFFPEKYFPYLIKEVPHDYLQKLHKLYNWAININSITQSRTMFANRVYELQANGCLMISNESIGVSEKFPEVIIVKNKEDAKAALERYSEEEVYEHQTAGIRRVMTGETNYDRICHLLDVLHISVPRVKRTVLVAADTVSDRVKEMFETQSYEHRVLISREELTREQYEKADMIALWSESCDYGRYYLEDMINGFKYTACDVIVKNKKEHDYVNCVEDVFASVVWTSAMKYEDFVKLTDGMSVGNAYSIDHFNYRNQER